MEVVIHKKIEALEKLFPQWEVLIRDNNDITVFQDFTWVKSWWEYKSKKQKNIFPYIIEIRNREKTIGLIPLFCSIIRINKINLRVLKPIGSGASDYLLPILSNEYSYDQQLRIAMEKLHEDKINWDYLVWEDIPEQSFIDTFFTKQTMFNSLIKRENTYICPFLQLNNNFEEVKKKFGKRHIKEILYKERKLSNLGNLQFIKVKSENEIPIVLSNLFEFHCERWENTATPSKYRFAEERENLIKIAKTLHKRNLLHLSYLCLDDEIIAVEFGMSAWNRRYLYLHANNMKYRKYSVGHILAYKVIQEACEEGYAIIDFLRGDQTYKKQWGTIEKTNVKYVLSSGSYKTLLLKVIQKIIPSKYLAVSLS